MNTGDCSRKEIVFYWSLRSDHSLLVALIQEKNKRLQTVIASGYCPHFFRFPPAAFAPVYNGHYILIAGDPY